jgi:hypothetical protein
MPAVEAVQVMVLHLLVVLAAGVLAAEDQAVKLPV